MKLAVISDIHSNIQAFSAVLEEIRVEEPDYVICLGDTVGYGANPNEVIQRLMKLKNLVAVKGNHDEAVLTRSTLGLNKEASEAANRTMKVIGEEEFGFLDGLSEFQALEFRDLDFFITHGSPENYLREYVYEDLGQEKFNRFFDDTDADAILLGHTHVPFHREEDSRILLNPGSVGQPRDGNRRASYAIIDLDGMEFEIRRTSYDVDAAAKAIKEAGLPENLAERLKKGE